MKLKFTQILSVLLLLIGVLCLAGISNSEASTIRISNPKIELELAPGETYSGEISVENPDNEEVKTKIYLEDWVYSPGGTGEKKFSPMGTQPLSCSRWIQFSPAQEMLKPYGRFTARYTISVPQDASGGYYSVLFFETILGTAQDEEGVNVLVSGRVGALFMVHVKGTVKRQGDVTEVKISPPSGNKPLEILTTFKNTGNVDIPLGGTFLLMDADGKVSARGDLQKIYTLPGVQETGTTQWVGRLPAGAYTLLLTYDLGQGQSIVKEETVTVS